MSEYITIIAWIFGVLSSLLIVLRLLAFATYSEIDRLCDSINGQRAEFSIVWPSVVAILCWSWVLK
jgi:hypothetical protein